MRSPADILNRMSSSALTAQTSQPSVPELLNRPEPSISFEFFPPKDDAGLTQLWATIEQLRQLDPTFVSVTYGAGGTTRDRTASITAKLVADTGLPTVAHLTCVGASRAELVEVVQQLTDGGVANLLALRGDPPKGYDARWTPHPHGLNRADELVELIREVSTASVGVAAFTQGHPEAPDLAADARVLAAKARAGADYAITQLFFTVEEYEQLRERATEAGVEIPIIAGLMPITNLSQIERFAKMSGVPVPQQLTERLQAVGDDPAAVRRVGIEAACELAGGLLAVGAPGLHCYTLNRAEPTMEILEAIGAVPEVARA